MSRPTVLDLFCGAGGFSEGFRQQGFKIVMGIDHWEPAIKTFNHNFGLNCSTRDILDFRTSVEAIEALPDTSVIVGSPPCVTFSPSNLSGKADKTSGVMLTKCFLRIVAVKKWKKRSKLKAWYMENVPDSIDHLQSKYTFRDLGLAEWAVKNKISPTKTALKLKGNQHINNSADYGCPQSRVRVVCGEVIKHGCLVIPSSTHSESGEEPHNRWRKLREVKQNLPKPSSRKSSRSVVDPNYPEICISARKLTDHFYDTGLYKSEWKQSEFMKTNHPYMGRMSFPENEDKPSRTVTATIIGTSRESLIYRSEYNRRGDGRFRIPTIRESACLMGFPITYQFMGTEGLKQRLVGNAVCPAVSRAFAKSLRQELGLAKKTMLTLRRKPNLKEVNDLSTFTSKIFTSPPRKNKGSRFRRHPFKDGNITVTLSNYDIIKNSKKTNRWKTSIQYGNGNGFPIFNIKDRYYREIEPLVRTTKKGAEFLAIINNGFTEKIGKRVSLQEMYEQQRSCNGLLEPVELIEEIKKIIDRLCVEREEFVQDQSIVFKDKEAVPVKQLFALYAINKVSTIANDN